MQRLIISLLVVFVLSACSAQQDATIELVTASSTTRPTLTPIPPTDTPQPTSTTTATPSPTVTETPLPTYTPTPTPLILPVGLGIAWPSPEAPINAETATRIVELARYGTARIYAAELSADASTMVTVTAEGIKVYDTQAMERIAWYKDAYGLTNPGWYSEVGDILSVSRDGSRFAIFTDDNQVDIYNRAEGLIAEYSIPQGLQYSWTAISPDGRLIALPIAGEEDRPRWQVVDIASNSVLAEWHGQFGIFTEDGAYYAFEFDSAVYFYRKTDWQEVNNFQGRSSTTRSWGWTVSPSNGMVAITTDDLVTIWEIESRYALRQLTATGSVIFSEDGTQVAFLNNHQYGGITHIWNIADGQPVGEVSIGWTGMATMQTIRFGAEGIMVFEAPKEGDGLTINLWGCNPFDLLNDQLVTGAYIYQHDDETQEVTSQSYQIYHLPNPGIDEYDADMGAIQLLTDTQGNLYTWRNTGAGIYSLREGFEGNEIYQYSGGSPGFGIAVSPRHDYLVSTQGDALFLRNIVTGTSTSTVIGRLNHYAFSEGGERLVVNSYQDPAYRLRVFDLTNNGTLLYRTLENFSVTGAVFLPSLDIAGFWDTNYRPDWYGIRVVDPYHQRILTEIEDMDQALGYPVASSVDGSLLINMGWDERTIMIYDLASGQVIHSWQPHIGRITNFAISPDGRYIATSGEDGFIRIWGVSP